MLWLVLQHSGDHKSRWSTHHHTFSWCLILEIGTAFYYLLCNNGIYAYKFISAFSARIEFFLWYFIHRYFSLPLSSSNKHTYIVFFSKITRIIFFPQIVHVFPKKIFTYAHVCIFFRQCVIVALRPIYVAARTIFHANYWWFGNCWANKFHLSLSVGKLVKCLTNLHTTCIREFLSTLKSATGTVLKKRKVICMAVDF